MTVTVFGAGGFIGSHVVDRLLDGGRQVIAVDKDLSKLVAAGHPSLQVHQTDLRGDPAVIDTATQAATVVVNLVAYANPSLYVSSPLEVFELNFETNLEVVRACVRHRRRLIQYSSAEVYGTFELAGDRAEERVTPLTYGPIDKHRWIYACGKQLLERVIHAYGLEQRLDYTIVRPFNFIGPRLDYLVPPGAMGGPRVVPHFISALLSGGPLQLVDGGDARRSFLHIDDATDAFMLLLDAGEAARNGIFNVGSPDTDLTIRELALLLIDVYREVTGDEPVSPLVDVAGERFYGQGYDDSGRVPPDITRMRSLGWEPRRDLRQALRDTLVHYLPDR